MRLPLLLLLLFQDGSTVTGHKRRRTEIPDSIEDTENSQTQFGVSVEELHAHGEKSQKLFLNNNLSQSYETSPLYYEIAQC